MQRLLRSLALFTVLVVEAAAVAVLLRLGARRPFAIPLHHIDRWLRTTTPPDALAAVLRLAAIATAAWLLLGTLAYAGARVLRAPAAIRATAWTTLPAVRRVVDAALAVSIVAGSVTGSLVAAPAAHATSATVRDGRAPTTTQPSTTGEPTTTSPASTAAQARAAAQPSATTVVAAGDDLWRIAARELARATGHNVDQLDAAVLSAYWGALCDANRAGLRSGDVNLVYPGEVLSLPSAPATTPPGG